MKTILGALQAIFLSAAVIWQEIKCLGSINTNSLLRLSFILHEKAPSQEVPALGDDGQSEQKLMSEAVLGTVTSIVSESMNEHLARLGEQSRSPYDHWHGQDNHHGHGHHHGPEPSLGRSQGHAHQHGDRPPTQHHSGLEELLMRYDCVAHKS